MARTIRGMEQDTITKQTMSAKQTATAAALAVRERAARAAKLSEHQKKAIDAGTSAVVGMLTNVGLAAVAGLIGGSIHPRAPQVIYSLLAVGVGVGIAEKNGPMGTMLVTGGMVSASSLVMQAIASKLSSGDHVATDPFSIADRVGRSIASTPTPSATQPPSPSPAPSAIA